MNKNKWIYVYFSTLLLSFSLLLYIIIGHDVYGVKSQYNKFTKFTTSNNHVRILDKINSNSATYLIGTSRVMRIDPLVVSSYTSDSVQNINISGSSFYENLYVSQKVKSLQKNVIFGFDAFSLNVNRDTTPRLNKLKIIEKNYTIEHYKQYINRGYLNDTAKSIFYTMLNKEVSFTFTQENNFNPTEPTDKEIQEKINWINNNTNYKSIPDHDLKILAETLKEEDIVVIYPKYYKYYKYFQGTDNTQKQYFHSIKYLVKNSKAKIYSFYGINSITSNYKNFDKSGWHFKPKISNIIFDCIYQHKCTDTGSLLTDDNVDDILNKSHNKISSYR